MTETPATHTYEGGEVALDMRGVHKTFEGKVVHRGVNLKVFDGEILTLVGGSGEGKSVLLKEIIGLMKPDAGEVYVYGQEVTRLTERELIAIRRQAAMVFQGSALFDSLTVGDNVVYGVREHERHLSRAELDEIAAETLRLVDMEGSEELFPAELSGGMKKRVAIARAVAMKPRIILYDEPTTGLDPTNVKRINDLIVKTRDATCATSIVVTHDLQSARRISDRLALLADGCIIAVGDWGSLSDSASPEVRAFVEGRVNENAGSS